MVPRTTVGRIADQSLISGDDAHTPGMRQQRANTQVPLVGHTCGVRPKAAEIDWIHYDGATVLIAHDPAFTPQQAVDLVAGALGRPIVLGEVA